MRIPTRVFEPNVFCLHRLDQQHAQIREIYHSLEQAIMLGQGMPGILDIADSLVQMMFLHFGDEERFLEGLSRPILQRQRRANMDLARQLSEIEDGLKQGKWAAVFQSLRLGKAWIKEHTQRECEEFEDPFPGKHLHGISA
jgi:hemerythrin